jgi:putative PLP-dependent aminotransferase (TIGR04422 family)
VNPSSEHFLWPKSRFRLRELVPYRSGAGAEVEACLTDMFPGTHPVLVSSGRAGIVLTLQMMKLGRPDFVGIAPFSSACIFQSVGEVATPVPGRLPASFDAQLVYHQWGYVHTVPRGAVIEDGVDSLCVSAQALFPNDGRTEVLSLSKLLGVAMGGVVFCRSAEDAAALRALRDARSKVACPQLVMYAVGQHRPWANVLWHHGEAGNGPLPAPACGMVLRRLKSWREVVADRRLKIELTRALRPAWLRTSEERLPCVVPVECDADTVVRLAGLGFTSGLRHFNTTQDQSDWRLAKVFPLPIHQDVPVEVVAKAVEVIMSRKHAA